jgi:hypothetical protein
MTKREAGFLLIGLGVGLPFAVVGVACTAFVLQHHMFILGFTWSPRVLLGGVLFLPLVAGCILLYRNRSNT